MTYICPKCGHTYEPALPVIEVAHRCNERRRGEASGRCHASASVTLFPPDPYCYACCGTGIPGFGGRPPCPCRRHEAGECEPDSCSPECKRRAEARGE